MYAEERLKNEFLQKALKKYSKAISAQRDGKKGSYM
jgi:hypothetical protein